MATTLALLLFLFSNRVTSDSDTDSMKPAEGQEQQDLSRVILLAFEQLLVGREVVILGDLIVNQASSEGPGLILGQDSQIPEPWTVTADSVQLESGSRVEGRVHSNQVNGFGSSQTIDLGLSLPVIPVLPLFYGPSQEEGQDQPGPIRVGAGESRLLKQGAYESLMVEDQGLLELSGGTYECYSLSLGLGARILARGPVTLRVETFVDLGSEARIEPVSEFAASSMILFIKGIDATLGAGYAVIGAGKNQIRANLYCPNGTVALGADTFFDGAIIARSIQIGDRARLSLSAAFGNQAPQAGIDLLQLGRGDRVAITLDGDESLLANDRDLEDQRLQLDPQPVQAPTHGLLELKENGFFSYTHDGSDWFNDSFVYRVCDSGYPQACSEGLVNISILPDVVTLNLRTRGDGQGLVSISPGGLTCRNQCSAVFELYQRIELFASPDPGSLFTGWGGDEDCLDGTLTGGADCIAFFEQIAPEPEQRQLEISLIGGQGTVISRPGLFTCSDQCSQMVALGTPVTLYARPDTGYSFVGWKGDCGGTSFSTMLQMDSDKQCQAEFRAQNP